MEFMFKSEHYNHDLSWHDFQLDHSWAYGVAMVLCFLEFTSREWTLSSYENQIQEKGWLAKSLEFISNSKFSRIITIIGIAMVLIGHAFRIGSMFYAGSNFNHLVQTKKAEGH